MSKPTKKPAIAPSAPGRPAKGIVGRDREYLMRCGWYEARSRSAWRWWKPPFAGAFYRLRDALALERSRSK